MLIRDPERTTFELPEAAGLETGADGGPAIRVSGVTKTFLVPHQRYTTVRERAVHAFAPSEHDVLEALSSVSLDVRRGEFFGIVGRNGSGKSTLLRCIAGIYVPDSGRVAVQGRLASFISLGVGFNPELPARENAVQGAVLFGLHPREAAERLEEIVAFAELERFVDQKLKHFSSGMAARLAFAVTIHVDADVLLFDEVLAVGDAPFQRKCLEHFERLRDGGKTIVLVTHDLGTVERFCDRALLLHAGRVVDVGAPEAIVEQYEELTAATTRPRSTLPAPLPVGLARSRPGLLARLRTPAVDAAWRAARRAGRLLHSLVRPALTAAGDLIAPPLGRTSMLGTDPRRFLVLTRMLAATDFRLKYQNAAFNYGWAIARPAALFGVMLLVFGELGRFDRGVPHYPAYLILGIVIWMFFGQAAAASVGCLTRRAALLQQLPFPRLAVPLSTLLATAIDLAVNLLVVFVFVLASGVRPRLSWLELPLLLGVVAVFSTGVGLLLAALYVRHRDLDQLWAVASQTLFYLTPIFYVAAKIPSPIREPLLLANPLAGVFTEARHALIDPAAPSSADLLGGYPMLLVPLGIVVGVLVLGLWVFARESPRVPEYV